MKYLLTAAILSFLIACKNSAYSGNPKEILRLVDKGNDGWNAFPISFRDDSTFKVEHFSFGASNNTTGKYTISGKSILVFWSDSRVAQITFDQTSAGCLYNVKYLSDDRTLDMLVIFDSLFCNHGYDEKIAGTWKYQRDEKTLTLCN